MSEEQHIITRVEDGIGTILLNRPEVLNAASESMVQGLIETSGRFERDPEVRCVVIGSSSANFMAGGDVKFFHRALVENREAHLAAFEQRVVRTHQMIYHLRRMRKPVIASVQGAAAGFGVSLMLAADLAIASDDAVFMLAYRHVGLTADGGATYFLPRLIGERKALELALLGEKFTAQQALEFGIVNWVVAPEQLAPRTAALARRLADGPTQALGSIKHLLRSSFDNSWDEHSHREAELFARAAATADHLEGVTAFVEKRKPVFTGQ
jgi:2-(1,2-epoxy-1,2-dihydrophenyl)acetyl-CoA isomerase